MSSVIPLTVLSSGVRPGPAVGQYARLPLEQFGYRQEFAKLKASWGDSVAYQYAEIYAQWGDQAKALQWLDTAMRLHDGFLEFLKTDGFLDPLRGEPRFQAIEQALRFPTT